ncbi:MAG TPA: type II secretion system F family protein [Candidatus Limnocylindrales bacterium]|nr:type II secretion system F family protein [Candidatus Limnocylindrales bacterium]
MMLTLVVAVVAALAIFMIFIGLAGSGGSGISARLERYAAGGRPEQAAQTGESSGPISDLISQSAAMATLNRAVEQRDFGANLAREIARADLKLKPSEYLAIWGAAIVGIPAAMFVLGAIFPTLRSPVFLIGGAVIGFFAPRFWLKHRQGQRLKAFNTRLADTITLIANALRAGSSFLQAIEMVVRESEPPISTEFGRVIREVNLGLPFDEALQNMVRRVRSDDLELMATAISVQHQVGGNLAEILDSIAYTIRERVRIKGEIRTLTAQQRLSGLVVGLLPIGLTGALTVIAPGYMDPMFQKPPEVYGLPAGTIILAFGGFMMFLGFMAIRKIVDIEV